MQHPALLAQTQLKTRDGDKSMLAIFPQKIIAQLDHLMIEPKQVNDILT